MKQGEAQDTSHECRGANRDSNIETASSYEKLVWSKCGSCRLDTDPFVPTGRKLIKIFHHTGGNIAAADKVKDFPFDVRAEIRDVHTATGIEHNMLLINKFTLTNYISIFDEDMINTYNATNTKIPVSKGTVLREWRVPSEEVCCIPLVKGRHQYNTNTLETKAS